MNGVPKQDKASKIKNRLDRAKAVLRSVKVEMRELSRTEQAAYKDRIQVAEEKINKLYTELDWAEKSGDRKELMDQASVELDTRSVLNKGKQIQEEDLNILDNVIKTAAQTSEIGASTLAEMANQRERMTAIDKDLDQISSNLVLARKHLRVFVRRIATDKIFLCLIFMIVAGIVVVIVFSIVHPGAINTNLPSLTTSTTSTSSSTLSTSTT